jgi:hypothetical protein
MSSITKRFGRLLASLVTGSAKPTPRRRSLLLEPLEERWCPDGAWRWNGPIGVASNWSNPANWKIFDPNVGLFVPAQAGIFPEYPGEMGAPGVPNSFNDSVDFHDIGTGNGILDVPINSLNSLQFTGAVDTLTLNNDLTVSGNTGVFALTDGSTIALSDYTSLSLVGLSSGQNQVWSRGLIVNAGTGAGTSVNLTGTYLQVTRGAVTLAPNMFIKNLPVPEGQPQRPGKLRLGEMTAGLFDANLILSGTNNYIEVQSGGYLALDQSVAAGNQDREGGIALAAAHTGTRAVYVEVGGELDRTGGYLPGAINEVRIKGTVYNEGGTVNIAGTNALLSITGTNLSGYSYWQDTDAGASLKVATGSNINATGTFQIDTGTVQLQALSNAAPTLDELDGAGMNFGNDYNTYLTITDSTPGMPGWVSVGGPVTLAANSRLTENFSGANNTADMLWVQNGNLSLAGTLYLNSTDNQKPTQALDFLGDSGGANALIGNFTTLMGNINPAPTYTGGPDLFNPGYYQVTIQ